MVSANGGVTCDLLYISDQISSSEGVINKFSLASGSWIANGSLTNSTGVEGLFANTNGNGGVSLFYTTGGGGAGNSIVRVTDAAGWNPRIAIVSSNVIYAASKTVSLKGLTFGPQPATNAPEPAPPPILTAQNGAVTNSPFSVTSGPDDPAWRSAITNVTVNGSPLLPAAYDTTQNW